MSSEFLGEMFGTLVLILLGNGVVACALLKRSYGEGGGWMVVTTGWGFAVICGVLVALVLGSDAHINPAITVGVSIATGDWSQAPTYIAAQMLGAMTGALLVWLHYLPHWRATEDVDIKRGCFCTAPAIRHTPSNLLSEVIGTFVLVFVAAVIFSEQLGSDVLIPGSGPLLVGVLVWGIGLSLGGPTGYAINPARDLGPRIMHAILPIAGKGDSGWDYAAVPVIGPLTGALLGGLAVAAANL
jgi:glycerol uptake facilitator protein